ncbi:PAS domain-containing protein [Dactylosporangium sp. NPDC006015]|uniref:PAS domain-containing protein n=1 Tax=Dactylosporangium sp. NPDC006015 TaxID=3154576 RepID=UPI0033A1C829
MAADHRPRRRAHGRRDRPARGAGVAARSDAQRQRAFLHALLECLDTGVAACDEQGRLVLLNRALRDFLTGSEGYEDSPPEQWADLFHVTHPDGRLFAADEMPLVRALCGQTVRSDDQIIPDRRGRPRRYTVNATPITDRDGRRLGAVAAVHDVTDQRRAERFRRCELAVARTLPAAADLEAAGRAVLAAVGETLGWPYAELWLFDPLTDVMRPAAAWTRDGPGLPIPAHLPTGAGLAGVAWTEQQPVWVEDIRAGGLFAADELEQVFERFHRSSRVRDLGIPGTGLGLPASRLIVHRHHGTITLRPTPGGGVTATVRLPLDQPPNGL